MFWVPLLLRKAPGAFQPPGDGVAKVFFNLYDVTPRVLPKQKNNSQL
jgi:hypothetical protein